MEFDQAYNSGAVDWNFPSPGATPTNASYTPNVLQTPKTATFPSHFHDAFPTPQMPAYTARQAEFPNMTARPQTASDVQSDAKYYAHMQMSAQQQGQAMVPANPAMYQNLMMSPMHDTSRPQVAQLPPALPYDTMQMQTPPPTRGSTARKPHIQEVAFGTPSTIATRRFISPRLSQHQAQDAHDALRTPMQHAQLQFSPDMFYQFGNFAPASAPTMTQTQLLWDQPGNSVAFHQQQQTLDNPFAPASSSSIQWSQGPLQQNLTQFAAFNSPAMNSFPVNAPVQRPASAVHFSQDLAPPMTTAIVDPSLVYSSPIRPPQELPIERPESRQAKTQARIFTTATVRKGSHSAEWKRIEHKRMDTTMTAASSSTVSFSTERVSRPLLQRSNTTGTTRIKSTQSLTGMDLLYRSNSSLQVPRNASPLKRMGRSNLGSIFECRKSRPPSVILTVDESGRARAVRTEVPHDGSPTKAMRERYPGLYDSDSSDEEFEEDKESLSRSASFSFSKGPERLCKAAKLDPPIETLDGFSIPRTSSATSMKVTPSRAAIAAAAQLRRGNSLRKRTPSGNSQRRVTSSTPIDTAPMDISQDRKQSFIGSEDLDRGLTLSSGNSFELDAHNRRWSMMSHKSISPTHQPQLTEMQFVQSGPHKQVRCQCGVNCERGQMIRCTSCTQHQHASCIGMSEGSAPPPNFTCFLCTKPPTRLQVSSRRR